MAEWIAYLLTVREVSRLNPVILPLVHNTYREMQSATMLAVERSAGVAPELNLRNPLKRSKRHARKRSILALKRRADITTRVSVATQKDLVSFKKIVKKKNPHNIIWYLGCQCRCYLFLERRCHMKIIWHSSISSSRACIKDWQIELHSRSWLIFRVCSLWMRLANA